MWQDLEGRYEWVFNLHAGLGATTFISAGPTAEVPPPATADAVAAAKARVIETGRTEHVELPITLEGTTRWYDCHIEPRRENDAVVGTSSVVVDVYRPQAGRAASAARDARTHPSLEEPSSPSSRRWRGRPQPTPTAPNRSSNGSARGYGRSARRTTSSSPSNGAAPTCTSGADALAHQIERVSRPGPALRSALPLILPEATQNLGLANHELSTNATKYGALSSLDGSIELDWSFTGDGDGERS